MICGFSAAKISRNSRHEWRQKQERAGAGLALSLHGLLECSECHGNITVVSGTHRKRRYRRYGCSMHAYRGDKVCTNSLLVSQAVLEKGVLAALQATVFNPAVLNYALNSCEERVLQYIENGASETGALEARITELEKKVRNFTAAIAEGFLDLECGCRPCLQKSARSNRSLRSRNAAS